MAKPGRKAQEAATDALDACADIRRLVREMHQDVDGIKDLLDLMFALTLLVVVASVCTALVVVL